MTPLARSGADMGRDVVMVADLGAAHAGEKFLGPIRASAVEASRLPRG